tara:strand:- start:3129 stop:3428 length:300 start_codon:yes stop_codon:yes gene_type:complete
MANKLITATIYDRVKKILEQYPKTRESDNALMASLWYEDADNIYVNLNDIVDGKLTNWEGATRARRKIMEEIPELRGKNYILRKARAQSVKNTINKLHK